MNINDMEQYLRLALIVIFFGCMSGLIIREILRDVRLWRENRSLRKQIKELEAGMDPGVDDAL